MKPVLYIEGPGDVVASYRLWASGQDSLSETSVTFSSQVFRACKEAGAPLYAMSLGARAGTVKDGDYTVTNLPRWNIRIKKIGYELTLFLYALRLMVLTLRLRPRMIFLCAGVTDWAYLPLLRLGCSKIVPVLHNALWPEGYRPRIGLRQRVYRFVWRHFVWHTLAVSPACARQIETLAGTPVTVFKPSFPAHSFENPIPKNFSDIPFRVMYAGRIEENKGVFDILSMAKVLPHIEFAMCGDGESLPEVKKLAGGNVEILGRLARPQLVEEYRKAHLVVAPTRSTFTEGFCMVAAEAVLLLRPVLTSPVVPASEVLRNAMICVNTDQVMEYVAAIKSVSTDAAVYDKLVNGAKGLRTFILDDSTSFYATVRSLLLEDHCPLTTDASPLLASAGSGSKDAPSTRRGT